MPHKKQRISSKELLSILYEIDKELIDLGVQRKLDLYCVGGTKLMLQEKKNSFKDIDFILSRRDSVTLGNIFENIQRQRNIIIDKFQDGQMPGYNIPDYKNRSIELDYKFNKLRVFYLDNLTFVVTKAIAGRQRDLEEAYNFLSKESISESTLRKRFSEFRLDSDKEEEIIQRFESFIKGYFNL